MVRFLLDPFSLTLLLRFNTRNHFGLSRRFGIRHHVVAPISKRQPMQPINHKVLFHGHRSRVVLNGNDWSRAFRPRRPYDSFHVGRAFQLRSRVGRSQRVLRQVVRGPCHVTRHAVRVIPVNAFHDRYLQVGRSCTNAISFRLRRPVIVAMSRTEHAFHVHDREPVQEHRYTTMLTRYQ